MEQEKILVVGAGISGATVARRLAERGAKVEVIEKRDHIAGNCYDYFDSNGYRISLYGPHFFHTKSQRVWNWVNRFSSWVPWEHRVMSYIREDMIVPVPANATTINKIFNLDLKTEAEVQGWLDKETAEYKQSGKPPVNSKESALQRVGIRLYQLLIEGYTKKQWDCDASDLDPSVLARIPVRTNNDDRYFSDPFQALPALGYTDFVRNMLTHPNIIYSTGIDYLQCPEAYKQSYNKTFYTGPVDSFFAGLGMDKLQYRSLRFEYETEEIPEGKNTIWPASQINFPSLDYPFTRVTEYRHMPTQPEHMIGAKISSVVKEFSVGHGDPYYPVPNPRNHELYNKYKSFADKEAETNRIYFIGRLASYKYFNMDEAMLAALEFADKFVPSEQLPTE